MRNLENNFMRNVTQSENKAEKLPREEKKEQIDHQEEIKPIEVVTKMEEAQSPEEIKEILPQFFDILEHNIGAEIVDDVNDIYNEMERNKELARLESVRRVVESLETHRPLEIGGDGDHYANAVMPHNKGLGIALAEGEAPGPVRFLIGFDIKTAIGFNPEGLEVHDIESGDMDLRDTGLRAALCRHVEGKLKPEQVHHFVSRIPREAMPQELLTKEEQNSEARFIFRGARITPEALPLTMQEGNELQAKLIQKSGLEPAEWIGAYSAWFRQEVSRDPTLRKLVRSDQEKALEELHERLVLSKKEQAA